jgi:predicted extracellular nuclease
MTGQSATVRGVVTRVEPGRGFYIQEHGEHAAASLALYIQAEQLSRTTRAGQELALRGRVAELGSKRDTLTALVEIDDHGLCARDAALPLTRVRLPLESYEREALEGMRVAVEEPLSLTDAYNVYRGLWTLSAGTPLRLPTEDGPPGQAAADLARSDRERSLNIVLPGPAFPAAPVGTPVSRVQGVFGHLDGRQQLLLESAPQADLRPPYPIDPPAAGQLRIVSLNLLNYFNGDGSGGGFPTARGARTVADFDLQKQRTQAALDLIQPHLLAVQELENDGFGRLSAARSLLDLLNAEGPNDWDVIKPAGDSIGGDIITVGLFYRQQLLQPVGPAELLHGPAFEKLSRVPVAQLFRERASGEELLVVVNHLKSKGRCPSDGPNADQGDGQGCWNQARVAAVRALDTWLAQLSLRTGTHRILVLGDMNAWRQEEPIQAYREAGYVDLVEELAGLPQHSFVYFGQRGTLDYALATPELRATARRAVIWHINADWPGDVPLPQPWLRMSDHDPVVVDLELSQAATSD